MGEHEQHKKSSFNESKHFKNWSIVFFLSILSRLFGFQHAYGALSLRTNLVQVITFQVYSRYGGIHWTQNLSFSHLYIQYDRVFYFSCAEQTKMSTWTHKLMFIHRWIYSTILKQCLQTSSWSFVLALIKYLNWMLCKKKWYISSEYGKNYYEILRIIRIKEPNERKK